MASFLRLHLEDSLEDIPKTRAMIDVLEKDSNVLKKFSKALSGTCQKILNAQVMMIGATQELSYYLRSYGNQKFPVNSEISTLPNEIKQQNKSSSTASQSDNVEYDGSKNKHEDNLTCSFNKFAEFVDEISSCFQVFVTQMNDALIYPLNKMVDNEFDELNSLSQMYKTASDEQEQALQRYLRLPNRKEFDAQRKQIADELFMLKKKFHQISMNYFSSLNFLQYKRNYILVEPMMTFIHGLKLFFKMGSETFNSDSSSINDFLNNTSKNICDVKADMSEEMNKNNQLIELLQQDESIYNVEQFDSEDTSNDSDNILQKYGYLNLRSKFPFISKWDRSFFFIQNGCLMHQQKNEIAGYSFLELKSDLTVSSCEIDDRRFTFQIASHFPKKIYYFQANNERDRNEWIRTLHNAIKEDNRAKIVNYMNMNAYKNEQLPLSVITDTRSRAHHAHHREPKFELSESFKTLSTTSKTERTVKGQLYKVRFLGLMNVRAEKGNECIHETIRQVMAARAQQNVFKMNEFNLCVNTESLTLFSPSATASSAAESSTAESTDFNLKTSQDLLQARFDLSNLAYWCSHKENQRLFGFIIKETNLKFICLVFESDVDSNQICDAITKSTQVAFQSLDEKKSLHFKKLKESEKEILLQNIRNLPDKQHDTKDNEETTSSDDNGEELLDAAFNSPNPNFIILDKEILESFNLDLDQSGISYHADDDGEAIAPNIQNDSTLTESNAKPADDDKKKKPTESDA